MDRMKFFSPAIGVGRSISEENKKKLLRGVQCLVVVLVVVVVEVRIRIHVVVVVVVVVVR